MKLRTKILIDKFVGIPSMFLLNLIFRTFLPVKQKTEPDNSKIRRIAVCKFMGMGSIIQSTPLLATVRKNYPSAEITFITIPKNTPIIECFPFIDKTVTISDESIITLAAGILKNMFYSWTNRIDIFIDLEIYSYFSTIFMIFCFPKYRIGFSKEALTTKRGVYSKMVYFDTEKLVKDVYLQAANVKDHNSVVNHLYDYAELFNNGFSSSNFLREKLLGAGKEYIVINPNASDLRIERRWDSSNYVALINLIAEKYPEKQIVLTGSKDEMEYVGTIFQRVDEKHRDKVINSSGKLSLKELIALMHNCSLMITNDSGPMHIAFALGKKTIALFGPCSPVEYSGLNNALFIYKKISCSPCVHNFSISPCNGNNQCMKLITTVRVLAAVEKMFSHADDLKPDFSRKQNFIW